MSDIEPRHEMDEPQGGLSTADLASGPEPQSSREVAEEPRSFASRDEGRATPLLAENEVSDFRERWTQIQSGFVDEPRKAVEEADGLVAQTMKRLAEMFANERSNLEAQWDKGERVDTEDLRLALQRYRSFFDRLLSF